MNSLRAGKLAVVKYDNPDDIMNFTVTIIPDEGFWKGGRYDHL